MQRACRLLLVAVLVSPASTTSHRKNYDHLGPYYLNHQILSPRETRTCSVLDFGAKRDGAKDDTIALQTAIDIARNNSRTVELPAGNYRITR